MMDAVLNILKDTNTGTQAWFALSKAVPANALSVVLTMGDVVDYFRSVPIHKCIILGTTLLSLVRCLCLLLDARAIRLKSIVTNVCHVNCDVVLLHKQLQASSEH